MALLSLEAGLLDNGESADAKRYTTLSQNKRTFVYRNIQCKRPIYSETVVYDVYEKVSTRHLQNQHSGCVCPSPCFCRIFVCIIPFWKIVPGCVLSWALHDSRLRGRLESSDQGCEPKSESFFFFRSVYVGFSRPKTDNVWSVLRLPKKNETEEPTSLFFFDQFILLPPTSITPTYM